MDGVCVECERWRGCGDGVWMVKGVWGGCEK